MIMFTLRVKDVIMSGEKEILKLYMSNGDILESSLEHPYMTDMGWIRANNIDISNTKLLRHRKWKNIAEDTNLHYLEDTFYQAIKIDGKRRWLHQYKWECENKRDIPKGFEIHHIDHDRLNNRVENLQLLSKDEHLKKHSSGNSIRNSSEKQLKHLEEIRPLASTCKKRKI